MYAFYNHSSQELFFISSKRISLDNELILDKRLSHFDMKHSFLYIICGVVFGVNMPIHLSFPIFKRREEWYKITQTTNYTFDGNSVKINIGEGLSTVKVDEYKSECSYRLLNNSINNSDSKAATYTITVSMNLPDGWLRITDVVTAYPDGNAALTSHTEN